LIFEESEALKIAQIITEKSEDFGKDKKFYLSVIKEMGANVLCSFFAAIADFSELPLVPCAPELITGPFKTVISKALDRNEAKFNPALILRYNFEKRKTLPPFLILLTSSESQQKLINAGKTVATELLSAQY